MAADWTAQMGKAIQCLATNEGRRNPRGSVRQTQGYRDKVLE
jgi:hypothetical protein